MLKYLKLVNYLLKCYFFLKIFLCISIDGHTVLEKKKKNVAKLWLSKLIETELQM